MVSFNATDRSFIENKYHLQSDKTFNPYKRMEYHGYEYPNTGFSDEEMNAGLSALTSGLDFKRLPHPVAKARAFAYVLDHARIDVNSHDWYACFYNWGRPISNFTCRVWKKEIFAGMPDVSNEISALSHSGAVEIWPDFDHVIPGWADLLSLGFPGLLKRAEDYHDLHRKNGISPETEAFFCGIEISYRAILRLLERYATLAHEQPSEKSAMQETCFRNLAKGAPQNTYEALQAIYLFFLLCECVDHYQTRSLGNGLDFTLLPFYRKDFESGAFSEEELDGFIAYFLLQFSAIGNYWGHPFYLGGTERDGSTRYSALSLRILDVYADLGIYNPKIQIKVNRNTPREVLYKVYSLIRRGISSFVFCCEPGMSRAVASYGADEDEARDFEISGCYETRVRGDESTPTVGYVNALKAVELALHNGFDPFSHTQIGPQTGAPDSFSDFEAFYAAFLQQWKNLIDQTAAIGNAYDPYYAEINPSNLFSATLVRPLKKGVDGYAFGLKFNNSSILNCGFASAVDAVLAVRALCFEEKTVSLKELVGALDADWKGAEELRQKALRLPSKYGNDDSISTRYAKEMAAFFAGQVNGKKNARGGVYKAIMHTAMQFVWQGAKTLATPDGRYAFEEMSKNASPVNGMDKKGVTALIRSALALEPPTYPESFCLDVMLHPSAVHGEEGLAAMDALVKVYMEKGGQSIQFNVFRADMLKDAQEHPEKYRNLQVRVCGWNVLWNNLPKAEQDAYIRRAETVST